MKRLFVGGKVKENAKTFCLYHLFDLCRIIQHAQKVEGERQVSVNSFARGDSHVTFHRCYFHVFSLRTSTWSSFIASLFVSLLKLILGVVLMANRYFERYKCLYQDYMDWLIMVLTMFWGTDCHVIIAWISQEENEDPRRPCVYERFVARQR